MKRVLLTLCGVVAGILGLIGLAAADNGPHGNYSATTDKCAGCHRAHTAVGDSLLNASATATDRSTFCYSCHTGGTGAYTDVKNGLFLVNASVPVSDENTLLPITNTQLLGGGFDFVRMNPDLTVSRTLTVTSNHMVSGGSNTVWGYGSITSTSYVGPTGVSLTCTSCHNPHGKAGTGNSATYRVLKGSNSTKNTPLFANGTLTVTASVDLPDTNSTKGYGVTETYFPAHSAPSGNGEEIYAKMSTWCSQCHTRYHAVLTGAPQHTDSSDAYYKFRHPINVTSTYGCSSCHVMTPSMVNYPGCISCHVAHGTGARMGTYSGSVPWPGGGTSPNGNARSALLRQDNRAVCQQCHNK